MTKTVIITLKTDGTMTTEAEGFTGLSCVTETQKLIDNLCKREIETKHKQEFYANETEAAVGA